MNSNNASPLENKQTNKMIIIQKKDSNTSPLDNNESSRKKLGL